MSSRSATGRQTLRISPTGTETIDGVEGGDRQRNDLAGDRAGGVGQHNVVIAGVGALDIRDC